MKKVLAILAGLFVVIIGIFFVVQQVKKNGTNTITVGELSQRAQEFVASQRQDPSSSWQSKQLDPTEKLAIQPPSTLQETPCFSINLTLPIRTVYQRESEACILLLRLNSPAAKLTISTTPITGPMSENSGVHMREVTTDVYKLEDFTTSFFSDSKTFSDPQGISFFALKDGKLVAVIFSETNDQEKILAESLPKVLETLMVY